MKSDSFRKIFSVSVFHTYYTGNICRGLTYKLSDETMIILNTYGFKLMLTTTGFDVYTDAKDTLENRLNYITKVTDVTAFEFDTTTNDEQFYHFTNLPLNQIGIINYNSSNVIVNEATQALLLQPEFEETTEADKLFKLFVNFEDLINAEETLNYEILFEARTTKWQYYIVNNTGQSFGELSINGTSKIEFEGPEETILQNGETAQLFSLENELLPLKEQPEYNFNLMSTSQKNGVDRTKIIFKGLPNPNPSILAINTNASMELEVASQMYVYV